MLYGTKVLGPVLKKHKYAYSTKSTLSVFGLFCFQGVLLQMDAGPDPPARRPLPKKPRLDRPRLNLLAWLHSTLEPKRRLRLPEGEVSAFVTSIADRLLAGALDDGSSVTGRSLKKFFTRAGPEASLDFLCKRHLTRDVAVWLLEAACRGRAGQLQDKGASPRIPKSRRSGVEEGLVVSRKAPTEDAGSRADDSAAQFEQTPGSKSQLVSRLSKVRLRLTFGKSPLRRGHQYLHIYFF